MTTIARLTTVTTTTLHIYTHERTVRLLVDRNADKTLIVLTPEEATALAGCVSCACCDVEDAVGEPRHQTMLGNDRCAGAEANGLRVRLVYETPSESHDWVIDAGCAWELVATLRTGAERIDA